MVIWPQKQVVAGFACQVGSRVLGMARRSSSLATSGHKVKALLGSGSGLSRGFRVEGFGGPAAGWHRTVEYPVHGNHQEWDVFFPRVYRLEQNLGSGYLLHLGSAKFKKYLRQLHIESSQTGECCICHLL